jgi:hypothetical protein
MKKWSTWRNFLTYLKIKLWKLFQKKQWLPTSHHHDTSMFKTAHYWDCNLSQLNTVQTHVLTVYSNSILPFTTRSIISCQFPWSFQLKFCMSFSSLWCILGEYKLLYYLCVCFFVILPNIYMFSSKLTHFSYLLPSQHKIHSSLHVILPNRNYGHNYYSLRYSKTE